jgi:predicted dehydrogenase
MTEPVRVVVVGCGDIAVAAHLPALQQSSDVELVAAVDVDVTRREFVSNQFGVATFDSIDSAVTAADIDAAVVATPPDVTSAMARTALSRGLHVLCEKPMAVDLADGLALHDAAKVSGRVVQVGFTNRFSPLVQRLRDAIVAGRLGSPLIFTLGAYDERYDPTNTSHLARMNHFLSRAPAFVHEGAHLADYVAFLTGSRPTRVSASGIRTHADFQGENFVSANVEWATGDLARLEVGWLVPALPTGHFRVLGPLASAEIIRREGRLVFDDGERTDEHALERSWNVVCFDRQLAHFVAAVRGEIPPSPTTADGLASLELGAAVVTSMREHRVVDMTNSSVVHCVAGAPGGTT